jgi:hypothetical protein
MTNYQLLPNAGMHGEPINGAKKKFKLYKPGEVVSSERDLVKLFPNKFVALPDVAAPTDDVVEVSEDTAPTSKPLGKDVTEKFDDAVENDLLVFYKSQKYYVTEKDDVADVLNEKPLKKSEVVPFIENYLTL